jgi:electron transfer flavoprotein alpha subunit
MSALSVDKALCNRCGKCAETCPFGAITFEGGCATIGAACKACRLCVKACPGHAISLTEKHAEADPYAWKGVLVFAEAPYGNVHPVALELLGKARELAGKARESVWALVMGRDAGKPARELIKYGPEEVLAYSHPALEFFRADIYANVFADCIGRLKPSVVLVGATPLGRSLAPRVAARFRTGLTADCTALDISPSGGLVQIRPAFGGNIMAEISTPRTRPQFATVRYKVMDAAAFVPRPAGTVTEIVPGEALMASQMEILSCRTLERKASITDADTLVVAGRGVREKKDIAMLEELAGLLGGQVACTRSVVEAGWLDYTRQIGLSGRTVKPKLLIACGVSGAVQFTAGMSGAGCIVAVNSDPGAPIFKVAHWGAAGDLYEVVPRLIAKIREGGRP